MGEVRSKPDMDDIHAYRKRYEIAIRLLRSSSISQRDKELIEKFCNDCFAQGITAGRVQKYAFILRKVAEWLGKDFDSVTEDDLKRVVATINTSQFTEWTKYDYKRSIKKFFRWLRKEELVSWLRCSDIKNRKLPEEILTEEDIKKMIDAARTPRDRAIVSVLYESGCRVREFLSMKIKHVSFDRYVYDSQGLSYDFGVSEYFPVWFSILLDFQTFNGFQQREYILYYFFQEMLEELKFK